MSDQALAGLFPYLWLIPAAPLAASALTGFFGPRFLKKQSHWPCVLALVISFGLSLTLFLQGPPLGSSGDAAGRQYVVYSIFEWIHAGDLNVDIVLRSDALTNLMLVMVTFVSMLVAIYSVGYMHHDPGYARYFAEIALFVFSMTMLVLSSNFLLLYVFWEAVGLCSYLLIGFWFQKPSASAAARKAFLVNRIGDFGFAIGIFLLWTLMRDLPGPKFGLYQLLDYDLVFHRTAELAERFPAGVVAVCLLLFTGAVGKSAQFPLHVWLPDAMEGPSPVSALIHAATMVTAGVYMVARCTPLFSQAPEAQLVVALIGGVTALLAALIALTQNDLKRVLAYSTVSQLGYMFLALGSAAGQPKLATFAVVAAMFHLFTHAFFKALLFLGGGSVMHAMGDVIDMRRFGGLRHVLKHTHWTFLFGAAALAGIIPFAGFWSKDEILTAVYEATHGPSAMFFLALFIMALATAFLTAFYTFRAYFMTFWGEERFPPEAGDHPHESPAVMLLPLMVLAICALGVGAALGPTHLFGPYLEQSPGLTHQPEHSPNLVIMAAGTLFAVAGVALAWLFYLKQPELPGRLMASVRNWYELSLNKFYLDEIYNALIVKPVRVFAVVCRVVDQYIVDGIVDLVGWIPALFGQFFRPVQNGLVQFYALAMILGLTVFVIALVSRLG